MTTIKHEIGNKYNNKRLNSINNDDKLDTNQIKRINISCAMHDQYSYSDTG